MLFCVSCSFRSTTSTVVLATARSNKIFCLVKKRPKRFAPDKSIYDVNLLHFKQINAETVDDFLTKVGQKTTEYDLPPNLLICITIQGLESSIAKIVMPKTQQA